MGLSRNSVSKSALTAEALNNKNNDFIIAVAGNPNVGKSTLFNALTGMNQHTGNWAGKTVGTAQGRFKTEKRGYLLVDIPGTYSLFPHSEEERVARDFICSQKADATLVVCDATCLERNLCLVLQIMSVTDNVVVCVNLIDEAKKKGIEIDISKLQNELKVPVVGTVARKKKTLIKLKETLDSLEKINKKQNELKNINAEQTVLRAEEISKKCIKRSKKENRDLKIDKIVTSRLFGYPIMLLLLGFIFWLTVSGANYPSQLLSNGLFWLGDRINEAFVYIGMPSIIREALVLGVYKTLAWVVSVMLPPMAIFFPLFTLLEDSGYLPRIAYNLDKPFERCGACGKQALTMCMGFGCNAAGVVGARIIDSPRERLLAIITNNFVPCNGRFPALVSVITMFFVAGGLLGSIASTVVLCAVIVFGIFMSFASTKILSKTLLKGVPSSFTLELPPYRRPQLLKTFVRSIFDRTLFVLARAVAISAPMGLVIWLCANIHIGDLSLVGYISGLLDPIGKLMGLDGTILLAFILGFPANEIVLPIAIMVYLSSSALTDTPSLDAMRQILTDNGWSIITAINFMIFSLCHFPCSTALLTIKKETGSLKWTAISFIMPTVIGIVLCILTNFIYTKIL